MTAFSLALAAALLTNGDFEMTSDVWRLHDNYRVERGAGRNLTKALVFHRERSSRETSFPTQTVELEKGEQYRFSAWIRTEKLETEGLGASVCVEWHDKDGTYLGGGYTEGVKGTPGDWRHVEGVTSAIPDAAASCHVAVYVSEGAVGTAWFDDVEIVPYRQPAVGWLASDAYRNEVVSGTVKLVAALSLPESVRTEDARAWFTVCGKRMSGSVVSREKAELAVAVSHLAVGDNDIGFSLSVGDRILGRATLRLVRRKSAPRRDVWIDDAGRTIVNGKPFFPLGMYGNRYSSADADVYTNSPFNSIVYYRPPAETEMDALQARGLKVVYSLKDVYAGMPGAPKGVNNEEDERRFVADVVSRFAGHPALLAWYVNDELSVGLIDRMRKRQDLLAELDSRHPTWSVVYQVGQLRGYMGSFDIMGTDPYPIPRKPLGIVAESTRKTKEAYLGTRPMWQVLQAFDRAVYSADAYAQKEGRFPTADELKSMTWQAVAEGANGIFYYSFFDLKAGLHGVSFEEAWSRIRVAAAEIKKFENVLLAGPAACDWTEVPDGLSMRTWNHQGRKVVLVVNPTEKHSVVRVKPPKPGRDDCVQTLLGPRPVAAPDRTLKITLPPFRQTLFVEK